MPTNLTDEQVIREAAKMAGWSLERTCGNLIQVPLRGGYCEMPPTVLMDDTDALLELVGALKFIDGCVEVELDMFDGYWKSEAWLTSNSVDALLAGAMDESIVTAFRSALLALLRQVVEEKNNGSN